MSRGKWIAIEGMNGSGKSAVMRGLIPVFGVHENFKFTREPGGTDFGEHLRRVLVEKDVSVMTPIDGITKELLFMADRRHHIRVNSKVIEMGVNVISDRSDLSFLAYGDQQNSAHIKDLFEWGENFHGGHPDLYIFLSCRPEIAYRRFLKRIEEKGQKNMDLKSTQEEFFQLYDSYTKACDMLMRHGRNIEIVNCELQLEFVIRNVVEVIERELEDAGNI